MMMRFQNAIVHILSPHIDDAFYSLGGWLPTCARVAREIRIYNIFSQTVFTVSGSSPGAVQIRKQEEAAAQQRLGLGNCIRIVDWGFPDITLRESTELDPDLRDAITSAISEIGRQSEDVILIPAGVGGHIDHIWTRKYTRGTKSQRLYYQEMPYLLWHEPVGNSMIALPTDIDLHVQAMACFRSQIPPGYEWESLVRARIKEFGGLLVAHEAEF